MSSPIASRKIKLDSNSSFPVLSQVAEEPDSKRAKVRDLEGRQDVEQVNPQASMDNDIRKPLEESLLPLTFENSSLLSHTQAVLKEAFTGGVVEDSSGAI
jgi:hypothetical protein